MTITTSGAGSIYSTSKPPSEMTFVQSNPMAVQQPMSISAQSAHIPVRTETTDTLLRLLICHYTASDQSSCTGSESCTDRTALDRLLRAVCAADTNRPVDPGYVDPQVSTLAQRILPHLVRIIYTDVATSDVDEPWSNNQMGRAAPRDESEHPSLNGAGGHMGSPLCADSKLDLVTSVGSHHSYADDHELDEDVDSILDALDDRYDQSDLVDGSELDALPPGTSIMELKNAAIQAIHRLVPVCQADANLRERDLGIVRLLAIIHTYTITQQNRLERSNVACSSSCRGSLFIHPPDRLPIPACPVAEVAALVRLSFYPEHRTAICALGGVHVLIALLRVEQAVCTDAGLFPAAMNCPDKSDSTFDCPKSVDQSAEHLLETSISLRRYICMALTNLTFGVAANKALLCRRIANLEALLAQLRSGNEELKQVSASVLRNLCWRTDSRSKASLRRVDAPRRLTIAAMTARRDSTLRTTLSALWNLSAHCSHNKRAVCSSQLHQNNCYPVLVDLLRNPPSLTVIVNACGTLWNMTTSPHCPTSDLVLLCRLGVVDLLHQLVRSPHELVRNSSAAVLRNLVHAPAPSSVPLILRDQSSSDPVCTQCLGSSDTTLNVAHSWSDPPSQAPVPYTEAEVEDCSQPVTESDQPYRRRMNSRSRLRFGLLSVVLEADDADEEAAEESYEDETDDNDEADGHVTVGNEGSIYPDQEALVADVSSVLLLGDEIAPQSQSVSHRSWNALDAENEQACIYADEGTPFLSDSTTTSCLQLPALHSTSCHSSSYPAPEEFAGMNFHSVGLTPCVSAEALPQVYAVEDTPSQLMSSDSPSLASNSPLQPRLNGDFFLLGTVRSSTMNDEGPQLPSPPLDFSALVSPLNSLHLDELDVASSVGFPLPPPPVISSQSITPCAGGHSEEATPSMLPTPFVFSRGTSSYISSADLDFSSSAIPSSPQSECSRQIPLVRDSGSPDYSAALLARSVDSGSQVCAGHPLEEADGVKMEEELAPLAFSNGDGVEEGNEGEEVRLPFAEEGTPQDGLSFTDEQHDRFSNLPRQNPMLSGRTTRGYPSRYSPWEKSAFAIGTASIVEDGIDDEDDETRHSHLIQECIASAMPGNSSYCSTSLPFTVDPSDVVLFTPDDDSLQTFAVEDTPFGGASTKMSSSSDLFLEVHKADDNEADPITLEVGPDSTDGCAPFARSQHVNCTGNAGRTSSSNSSSINGDTSSDLLSEVIQSAMPKSSCPSMNVLCPASVDGDCLQFYAVEGTPGEDDLSDSSSMHNVDSSGLNSLASHSSSRCSSTTLPTIPLPVGFLETTGPFPPAPPRRTSSVLSSQKDLFTHSSLNVNRPLATVAPMPQAVRCSPAVVEPSCSLNASDTKQVSVRDTGLINGADKEDASSFSSLLSIESVGLEHSLLQECISSALPRPEVMDTLRKRSCHHQQHQLWHQLHPELCCAERAAPLHEELQSPELVKPLTKSNDEPNMPSGEKRSISAPKSFSTAAFSQQPATSFLESKLTSVEDCILSNLRASSAPVTLPPRSQHKTPYSSIQQIHCATDFSDSAFKGALLPFTRYDSGMTNGVLISTAKGSTRLRLPSVTLSNATLQNNSRIPSEVAVSTRKTKLNKLVSPPEPEISRCGLSMVDTTNDSPSVTTHATMSAVSLSTAAISNHSHPPGDQTATQSLLAEGVEAVLLALQNSIDKDTTTSDPCQQFSRTIEFDMLAPGCRHSQDTSSSNGATHYASLTTVTSGCPKQPSKLIRPSSIPQFNSHCRDQTSSSRTQTLPSSQVTLQPTIPSTTVRQKSHIISKVATPARKSLKLPSGMANGYRPSMTCPPSAAGRSPFSSRPASATGSQSDLLHSANHSVQPRSPFVSPQSVCAALVKQERVNATTKKFTSGGIKTNTSRSALLPTSGASSTTVFAPHSRTITVRPSFSSVGLLEGSRSTRSTSDFGFVPTTSISASSIDIPKPIRGGRKSLIGRKLANSSDDCSYITKPMIKPSPALRPGPQTAPHTTTMSKSHGRSASAGSRPTRPVNAALSPVTTRLQVPSDAINYLPPTKSQARRANTDVPHSVSSNFNGDTSGSSGLWIVRGELDLVDRAS
ncbi:unnamed protein product [Dicrocoelium dendriticum]|nr:unnamed protein product [Dicrocoelium dendriticum]